MKILIAEDDLASRKLLYKFLSKYGECDITVDGMEAIEAFMLAYEDGKPYDLICLDIMMPKVDGQKVLETVRKLEEHSDNKNFPKVKIIMMTALNDTDNIYKAFESGCQAYASKPLDLDKLVNVMKKLELI